MIQCHRKSCKNKVEIKGRKYCKEHSCRVAGCLTANDICRLHYCWTRAGRRCGQPIKKEANLCLEFHACPTCGPAVARGDCRLHYCWTRAGVRCGQPIKKEGHLCSRHACHECGPTVSRDECSQHYCQSPRCTLPVHRRDSRYCEYHACGLCDRRKTECVEHRCLVGQCDETRQDAGAKFCQHHTCPIPGCLQPHLPCKDHACERRHCRKIRLGEGWPFCSLHSALSSMEPPHGGLIDTLRSFYKNSADGDQDDEFLETIRRDAASADEAYTILRRRLLFRKLVPIVQRLNKAITVRDTSEYDLLCDNYCSRGYCSCDVMPRIEESYFWRKIRYGIRWVNAESVRLLSPIVRTHEDEHYAWTIPTKILEQIDLDHPVENVIQFERLYR